MVNDATDILPDERRVSDAELRALASATAIPAHVVQSKGHGHAGTAMALAPLAHVLFQRVLRHDPADPAWEGRDRFVLSAGHASLLLYVQLHLTGYGLELADLAASRALDSRTPGHPELGHTPGVEMSTGPLGQGVASAVGLALAARRDAALHDAGTGVWDPTVYVIAGDGCLQEGVSGEASSLAGTLALDNLVLIWDDNAITIDGGTELAFGEDVRARYRAYGWRVIDVEDSRDLDALEGALRDAAARDGRPTLLALRTEIGWPSKLVGGTSAAHAGAFGEEDVAAIKEGLGFAGDAPLDALVEPSALAWARGAVDRGAALHAEWEQRRTAWAAANPEAARRRSALAAGAARPAVLGAAHPDAAEPLALLAAMELPAEGAAVATRKTNGQVLALLQGWGGLFGGSADLSGSTNVALPGRAASATEHAGDFVHFGIREHAMAAMLTGIALHGLWRPYGSTYLAFSDYQRPAVRLQALMGAPVLHVYTHDSVAVGEDGPTHQPVEQIAALRTIPGLDVIRPADAVEVAAVWRRILERPAGPVALVLSRQDVPVLPQPGARSAAAVDGAYVAWQHGDGGGAAILATGSEVHVAIQAAEALVDDGIAVRVVSMPCWEWFEQQEQSMRDRVLPPSLRARVAVEAGRGDAWHRWVGLDGRVVSIERFGESGPGAAVLERRGITAMAVAEAVRSVVAAQARDTAR
ncbi:transketolase family protein [Agrococcus carbonis]|uniref:transketolase n=1 Tax=Agrococcus carbonis TaxID=684552 RepID=A0A1H1NY60_9MICO|nr:transketolase [Agrococcus carbonis]SDS03883.1 transketolase [Agrococcus carbonis]